jgi:hypothetical protein
MTAGGEARILLFGIGAQKAATTWLFEQLNRDPRVHLPLPKELHYWDTVRSPYNRTYRIQARLARQSAEPHSLRSKVRHLVSSRARQRLRDARGYERLISSSGEGHGPYVEYLTAAAGKAEVIGDITPSYALLSRRTFAEMNALHPGAHFLLILRDPVDRMVSGVRHVHRSLIKSGRADAGLLSRSFDEAVENPGDPAHLRSDYSWTLAELEAAVPGDRVLVLFYETLFDSEAFLRIATFLDLHDLDFQAGSVVHRGVANDWVPSEDQLRRAREVLDPVYRDIHARFGDAVPSKWMRLHQGAE